MNRRILIAALAGVVGLIVFVALWFEPQALLFDRTTNEAVPAGAVPLVVPGAATASAVATAAPATAAITDATTSSPETTAEPITSTTQQVAPPPAANPAPAAASDAPPPAPEVESAAIEPTTTVQAPTPTTSAPTTIAPTTTTPPATAPPPAPTQLISLDHGTSGNVSILLGVDGIRYLRFEGLDTDNGPDLKVYLSGNAHTGSEQAFDDQIVNLGGLKANKGDQNYAIPGDVDLSLYASVVIWCDRFDSAFGAAPLPR